MKKTLSLLFCLVLFGTFFLLAQSTGSISGYVSNLENEPLVGVNITLEGTNLGSATDKTGHFFIDGVEAGTYTLSATYIGYKKNTKKIEVQAGKENKINLVLTISALNAEDVIVIGYGNQKSRDITGSVSNVQVENVQKISATEVSTALQGRAAGVDVSQISGAPRAGAAIKVRGAGTLGNASPLVIVDGVPSTLSSVNPNDIKSLNILKDASAAAIYGSRAGNGVMIITTKRGGNEPIKINFNSKISRHVLAKEFPLVTNSKTYINIVKEAADNANVDYPEFVSMYDQNPSQFSSGTDWQDAYFRNPLMQDYDLTIKGGSENYNFAVSGNYSHQKGIVVTTQDERMGLRINSDFTKGKFTIGESFSINRSIGKGRYEEGGINTLNQYSFFSLCGLSPLVPVHDENNPTGWSGQDPNIGFYREIDNIVANMNLRDNKYDNIHLLASGYIDYKPMKGMTYTARLSQNIHNNYLYYFNPKFSLSNLDMNDQTNMNETRSRSYHTIMDHTLNYKTKLGKHEIDALAGYSKESTTYRSTYGSVTSFPSDDLRVLRAGTENDDADGYMSEWHFLSYFGRINYSYANKYLMQVNFRRDGSSRFSENNRWGNFPSVSFGWRLSEESYFNIPFINDFKIRGSYGILGMQEFGNYMYYNLIASDDSRNLNYPFGPGKEQIVNIGARSINYPSVGLKWEESKQANLGFDATMLNNKLSLGLNYYIKKNEDVLYAAPIPYSAGATSAPTVNAATIENRGVEIEINYREMVNPLKYQVNFNATTYNNEVTHLGRIGTEVIWGGNVYWAFDDATRTEVGRPLASFYLYETEGIFNNQSELDEYRETVNTYIDNKTPALGDVKYIDQNGDGVIDTEDKKYFGSAQPSIELGLNMDLSYKRFDFNIFLYSVIGKQMFNGARMLASWTNHTPGNYHKDIADAWTPENSNSNIPRVIQGDDRNTKVSDLWLEDASYLRLRHMEIGYTFPPKLIKNTGLQSVRFYIAADNLFTLTKYTGYDPAIDFDTRFSRGVDRSPYPTPRQYITGFQITL